ncbi:hypothetical protein ACQKWADRAFT_292852 [Trichoderma austrokoningii]
MAPHMSAARRSLAKALLNKRFKKTIIATVAGCSKRTVQPIHLDESLSTTMPIAKSNPVGRPSKITSAMRAALREFLDIRSDMERSEIIDYFRELFSCCPHTYCKMDNKISFYERQ